MPYAPFPIVAKISKSRLGSETLTHDGSCGALIKMGCAGHGVMVARGASKGQGRVSSASDSDVDAGAGQGAGGAGREATVGG